MKKTVGRIGIAALTGTVMLTALAALPASATTAVAQPPTRASALTSAQPASSATTEYAVVATGSISIQGSKTSGHDNAINSGDFVGHSGGSWSGFVKNTNGDQIAASFSALISPTSLQGGFYLIPKSGGILTGGGRIQGHQNANGDLVYSGTLYFNNSDYSYHQNVTVTNLTLQPLN